MEVLYCVWLMNHTCEHSLFDVVSEAASRGITEPTTDWSRMAESVPRH